MSVENNETRYWKIAAGEGGYIWPEQRDFNVISVGWPEFRNLKKYRNNEVAELPKQLRTFYETVQKDDWVIACAGRKIFGFGQIVGGYEFRKRLQYRHCRPIRWEKVFWEPLRADDLKLNEEIKSLFKLRSYQITVRSLKIGKLSEREVFNRIKKAISSRPYGIADLVEWEGLRNAPKSEQETIVLFSRMSPVLRMKISYVSTRYPDAIIRVKQRKSWVTKTAEFELRASGFEDHEEKYKKEKRNRCDLIICWENDWVRKPRWVRDSTRIIELKKELGKII